MIARSGARSKGWLSARERLRLGADARGRASMPRRRDAVCCEIAGLIALFAPRQDDALEYLPDQEMGLGRGQAAADDQIVDPKAEHRRRIVGTFSLDRNRFGHRRRLSSPTRIVLRLFYN